MEVKIEYCVIIKGGLNERLEGFCGCVKCILFEFEFFFFGKYKSDKVCYKLFKLFLGFFFGIK